MASEVARAIYRILKTESPTTAAGACHILRHEFTPVLLIEEAERSLELLAQNGLARRTADRGFGPEYLRIERSR